MKRKNKNDFKLKIFRIISLILFIILILSTTVIIILSGQKYGKREINSNEVIKQLKQVSAIEFIKENENKSLDLINDLFIKLNNHISKDLEIQNVYITDVNLELANSNKNKEIKLILPTDNKNLIFNNNSENYLNKAIKFDKNANSEETYIMFRLLIKDVKQILTVEENKLKLEDEELLLNKLNFKLSILLNTNIKYEADVYIDLKDNNLIGQTKTEKILTLKNIKFKKVEKNSK